MKINLYINKEDFDPFFIWMNRLSQGIIDVCPITYSHIKEDIKDPLNVSLTADKYALIHDVEKNIEVIQNSFGNLDILYEPQSLELDKILIGDILKNATRHDLAVNVINTAVELAMLMPDITPLEAMIISEREWLSNEMPR
jgi:hypothetical protein